MGSDAQNGSMRIILITILITLIEFLEAIIDYALDLIEPARTGPFRAGPAPAWPSRAGPGRAGPTRHGPARPGPVRAGPLSK